MSNINFFFGYFRECKVKKNFRYFFIITNCFSLWLLICFCPKRTNFFNWISFHGSWRFIGQQGKKVNHHCVKSVRIRSYSGPYFPAFGLNPEGYGVYLRIQSECGKIRARISPNTDTFHAVHLFALSPLPLAQEHWGTYLCSCIWDVHLVFLTAMHVITNCYSMRFIQPFPRSNLEN